MLTFGSDHLRRLGPETTSADFPWSAVFLTGGATIAAACANKRLRLVPLDGSKEKKPVAIDVPGDEPIACSPDGTRVIAGGWCVDLETGKKLWRFKGLAALSPVYTPDGKQVITGGGMNRVDPETGKVVDELRTPWVTHINGVCTVAVSPDGKTLAAGCRGGLVSLTDLATDAKIASEESSLAAVHSLVYGRDVIAVGGAGTEVRLLSPRDLSLVRALPVCARAATPADPIAWPETRVAFARDGVTLVATTNDPDRKRGFVQVWDASTGEERIRIELSRGVLWRPAVSDDGRRLAVAASSGVYVCDVPS